VKAFYWELEDAEHGGINILSKNESDAIYTLMKVGLATKERNISIEKITPTENVNLKIYNGKTHEKLAHYTFTRRHSLLR
jgi:hypothetical protein